MVFCAVNKSVFCFYPFESLACFVLVYIFNRFPSIPCKNFTIFLREISVLFFVKFNCFILIEQITYRDNVNSIIFTFNKYRRIVCDTITHDRSITNLCEMVNHKSKRHTTNTSCLFCCIHITEWEDVRSTIRTEE